MELLSMLLVSVLLMYESKFMNNKLGNDNYVALQAYMLLLLNQVIPECQIRDLSQSISHLRGLK